MMIQEQCDCCDKYFDKESMIEIKDSTKSRYRCKQCMINIKKLLVKFFGEDILKDTPKIKEL